MLKDFNKYLKIILIITVLIGCKRNQQQIRNVPVNITIYPSTPAYFNLSVPGGWVYINGGVKGIIVYKKSNDEFLAYERCSTYEPENECAVNVDTTNNVILIDPCSNSRFLITDGSVQQGPAFQSLKKYFTSWDGNALYISN